MVAPIIPGATGKIGWDGQALLDVDREGLTLAPGVGLYPRTDGGRLLLDATQAGAAETLSLFVPGVVGGAASLGKFANTRWRTDQVLTVIEAQLKTAPVGADGVNHVMLRVAGSLSGQQDVPLLAAYNALNFAAATARAGTAGGAVNYSGAINGADRYRGWGFAFKTAADQNVQSVSVRASTDAAAVNWKASGVRKLVEILDANYNVIVGGETTAAISTAVDTVIPLPVQVTLTQGVTYYVALRLPDGLQGQVAADALALRGGTVPGVWVAGTSIPTPGSPPQTATSIELGSMAPAGAVWRDFADVAVYDGANVMQYPAGVSMGNGAWFAGRKAASTARPNLQLNGTAGGVVIGGDLNLSTVVAGTGGTTPGNDLNVRLSVAAG